MEQFKYSNTFINHSKNPKNEGVLKLYNSKASQVSSTCGDSVTFYLKIKNNIIEEITFESFGCASNVASASLVTEFVKNKDLEFAKKLTWKQITEGLGGIPDAKVHCTVLILNTLKEAIEKYENEQKSNEKTK